VSASSSTGLLLLLHTLDGTAPSDTTHLPPVAEAALLSPHHPSTSSITTDEKSPKSLRTLTSILSAAATVGACRRLTPPIQHRLYHHLRSSLLLHPYSLLPI
jgi:hypothetical protein